MILMTKVQTRWLTTHVTPTNGYNNNVPFNVHYCYKCGLTIQEDMYDKYLTGYYKFCPSCGAYMVDDVQPIVKEERCNNELL